MTPCMFVNGEERSPENCCLLLQECFLQNLNKYDLYVVRNKKLNLKFLIFLCVGAAAYSY